MSLGPLNLSELYKFDELYWIPSEQAVAEASAVHLEPTKVLVEKQNVVKPEPESEPIVVKFPIIATPWVVIGQITDQEKQILKQAFSAAPLSLGEADWSTLELTELPSSFSDFIQNTAATKYIFLGEHSEKIKNHLPTNEFSEILDSKVLVFPRLMSSLTDTEKHLKLAFWNHLKALI